ncbi:response regulator transcription factor [Agathobaculum sp. Marseille-P7918]|uniref:response regulator transcription factor n=1 Tax=Agathobaculum sp. Marseille-P7918 TaxID=2479843 RepID=UPI000F62E92C|nr:response regulator transcription factor [Agathobaculum sp. Marseille-P7918]
MKRIFFVEDDLSLIHGLSFALRQQGYEVIIARTCLEAETLWQAGGFDLAILDVTLPDGSGFDLCRRFRQSSKVPILFLTAADEETDVIMGLDIGGDDYITKPFKLAIFLSRVNALLRRSGDFRQPDDTLQSGGIIVHQLTREVIKDGAPVELTASEYKLLCFFLEHPNLVLSPEQILSRLWDCEQNYIDSSTLTVYIRRLRAKIEDDPSNPKRIITVRRMGYKWNAAK